MRGSEVRCVFNLSAQTQQLTYDGRTILSGEAATLGRNVLEWQSNGFAIMQR